MVTRSPIFTALGSTSVISDWKRPPPSKSSTATTIGGEGEKARRSTVNVAIEAGTSAMRSGAMRSTAWHFTHTRWGGRWRAPQAWHRLPTNANFHASARRAGGASGACGSGRRGGSRSRKPRHDRNVGYDTRPPPASWAATPAARRGRAGHAPDAGVGAVGQRDDGDEVVGLRRVERGGEHEAGVGGARVADAGEEVVGDRLLLHAGRRPPRASPRGREDRPR